MTHSTITCSQTITAEMQAKLKELISAGAQDMERKGSDAFRPNLLSLLGVSLLPGYAPFSSTCPNRN